MLPEMLKSCDVSKVSSGRDSPWLKRKGRVTDTALLINYG